MLQGYNEKDASDIEKMIDTYNADPQILIRDMLIREVLLRRYEL